MAIRGIIFDLDGTLVDTIGDLTVSLNHALITNGFDGITVERTREIVGNGVRRLCSEAAKSSRIEQVEAVLAVMRAHYAENYKNVTQIYDGITELLNELTGRNVFLSVLTNKVEDVSRDIMKHYFSSWEFYPVYGAVDGRELKPDPEMLHKIMEMRGLSASEVLYAGDSEVDIQTARNAGVKSVAVSWGFRPRAELAELEPDFLVDKPREILELLDK
ncbi:Phosphoglycolate phosphatase [Limihaloglobus sulfuriphilus]|uniref:phosphoglycolate phosphatase n=1 Tax=Limihaloglobus sulfuriphilus TaxID=1851148 RepID=A0A1Q2MDC5_9BACT|nr:HAD family hydrolase [Limihaloglobus sulfuriphilus]AQQ70685.1 Phosphoglycolate phosphatase [Limihaloglobus sulfuriphilus]